MRKIQEQKQALDKIELLMASMYYEIRILRNITYRYYLKHGESIESGEVEISDHISPSLSGDVNNVSCKMIDHKKLGIASKYQAIEKAIDDLI